MVLTTLSFLARFGVLSSSVIVLGLGVTFIQNRASNTEFLIYIEALSALTVLGSMVPPYPNFVYDLVWTLAWTAAAAFALIVQFFESDCYGFRSDGNVGCATYKASTAFAFLCMLAWLTSTLFGGLRILDVIFDIRALTNRQGFGNSHIASHFICYCVLGVVLIGVGSPVLFIWAAPAFGRYIIYRTPIPDYNVTISNPTNDNISFTISSNIRVPDRFKVSVDPMHAVFFLQDRRPFTIPVLTVDLPKLSFRSNERIELVNQTLKLGNLNEFARLIEQVVYQSTFRIAARARAKIRLPPIPATWIDIDGAVELPAFDNFAQIDIREVGVQLPDGEGYNVVAEMVMANPSPVSVSLVDITISNHPIGDITLRILVGDIQVGRAFVALNDIVPGNNTLFLKGILDYGNIQQNIMPILKAEAPYLKEGLIMASAVVESVVYQGQHLDYWVKSFQSIKVSAITPVKPLFSSVIIGNSFESGPMGIPDGGGVEGDAVASLADAVLKIIDGLPVGDKIDI
ncbi:hypothetical protein EMCG_04816 [[Emmonsia] crescens]|uniref:Uncharacterized protein n=1 Tax=[Emmonsia] crescens TaxID=73230 RepID=A0A0G2HR01_9EURO|nr:hypothetical protein EMCG_04816 [Emmonsia crescens UAMH 3008]